MANNATMAVDRLSVAQGFTDFLPFLFLFSLSAATGAAPTTGSVLWEITVALHVLFLALGLAGIAGIAPLGTCIGARLSGHILRAYWAASLAFVDVWRGSDFDVWEKIDR